MEEKRESVKTSDLREYACYPEGYVEGVNIPENCVVAQQNQGFSWGWSRACRGSPAGTAACFCSCVMLHGSGVESYTTQWL